MIPMDNVGGRSVKVVAQKFYDEINAQLDTGPYGEFSYFLNWGYVPDGSEPPARFRPRPHELNGNSVRLLLEAIGARDLNGRDVIDISCGRGGTAQVIARFFQPRKIVGLDLSFNAVRFDRRQHERPGIAFCVGDAERTPFAAASFDVVTNIEASHAYPEIESFYAEVSRVLRPGGWFIYSDALPAGALERARRSLGDLGFTIGLDRDITANVLRSCDEVAGQRARAFSEESKRINMFLGTPGSDIYGGLKSGSWKYMIFQLQKRPTGLAPTPILRSSPAHWHRPGEP
jgi:ubiquinone/menaquinone biosynthesis C-methylase UbiE